MASENNYGRIVSVIGRVVHLKLERCSIRDWEPGDAASLALHANNRKVWRTLRDAFPHPYTKADAERWIRTAMAESPPTQFAIEVGGAVVGGIGIIPGTDVYRHSAELGYWLGEPHWRHGIMTDAVRAFTEYAFDQFDLCRIAARVFEGNEGSIRVLEKAGYRLEGRLRRAVVKEGRILDELVYAAVRE